MQEPVEVGRERDSLDKKLDIQGVPVHLEAVASVATTCTGLELAWVPRVPGTRQNTEHHLWHLRILRFLILTGTRRAHSM